jgi:hypothetical protein
MPPGLSSEHFGPPERYYWDDVWSLAGLRAVEGLLDRPRYAEIASNLHATLARSWAEESARCEGALPGAPGRRFDLSAVGALAAWNPLGLLPPDDPYLAATLRALEDQLFHDGALFVNTGHSGWGTYINMRIAGCYLLQGDDKGWELTRWLVRHASPTLNWPEAIHTRSGRGSTGDGHHGWACAEWLLLVRSLLLRDEGRQLYITPYLPEEWLQSPGSLSVYAAPTRFGLLAYTLQWDQGGRNLCLALDPCWRAAPKHLLWKLPGHVSAVTVDGALVESPSGEIVLPTTTRMVEVAR